MQIFVKTLTGRKSQYTFDPENTVLTVKYALQEKEGIQIDQIRLIYKGKQLGDDLQVGQTIAPGDTLHMVLQLRGGAAAAAAAAVVVAL